jgi:hypothetical protein
MTGRPSSFTQEYADSICEHIAGGRSLVSWCKEEGSRPSYTSVMRWLEVNEGFRESYTRARQDQADYLAEEIVQIADDGANDSYKDDEGRVKVDQDVIARSRLRVDARKWYASKLAPKKYGDKIQTEHSGEMTVRSATDLKDDELAAIATGSGG